jgi:2-hydroxychromene-2-carboxylate isomerase
LNDETAFASALTAAGEDPLRHMPRTGDPEVKAHLKAQNEMAQSLGIFGAPSFVTADGELFRGDDRLEQAIDWRR